MSFHTEHVLVWTRRCFLALAVAALALGCGTNGDQLLGTIKPEITLPTVDASTSVPDGGGACRVTADSLAQPVGQALAISLLIDRSQSALDPRNDKWDALFAGLTRFFHSNDADGVKLGAVYYPNTSTQDSCNRCMPRDCMCLAGCGCPCDQHGDPRMCSDMCNSNQYTRPDVEMAPMPQNAGNLAASLAALPSGPATLRPALQGALDHANWYQTQPQNQNERVAVVLVASWGPSTTECTPDAVVDAADVAASSNNKTYVVEFNYAGPDLTPIAIKGGGRLYQFDSQHDDIAMRFGGLVQDLEHDQQTSSCQYDLPAAITDPNAVTFVMVQAVDDAGVTSSTLRVPRVKNRFACDNQFAWFYDQADHPTRIITCDQLCETIRSTAAKVSIPGACIPVQPPP